MCLQIIKVHSSCGIRLKSNKCSWQRFISKALFYNERINYYYNSSFLHEIRPFTDYYSFHHQLPRQKQQKTCYFLVNVDIIQSIKMNA